MLDVLRYIIEIPLLLYALVRGTQEAREALADRIRKLKKEEYRVKRTVIKDLMRENHTETVKLRDVRPYVALNSLSFDTQPFVVETGKYIPLKNLYSIPGRADLTPDRKIVILFLDDERLKSFHDHPVVLGYICDAPLDEMYGEPGLRAKQPVGTDCLVYEAHFPPNRFYKRVQGGEDLNTPRIVVKTSTGELDTRKYSAIGGQFDFRDGLGLVDWFRVTIPDPPQKGDIDIDWFWEEGGAKIANERNLESGAR
jgi:hypothetical protein